MSLCSEKYNITYQNDAIHSYMVFKLKQNDKLIDYQIKIIKDNPTQNLLTLHRKQFDNEIFIHYDITSKITIDKFLERRKLNRHEFLSIVKSIIKGLQTGKQYLLQGGKYILDIKYMYINPSSLEVSLAYMPIAELNDIKEDLRTFFTELIVYKVVFEHPEEGNFVYRLLNLLKSEAFSLEQLDKLVYDIAVEYEQPKAIKANSIQSKEPALTEYNPQSKISLPKNKLYISMLVQLFFIALATLILRLMVKQNPKVDIYSIIGALLLIVSVDFLVIKRFGLLEKHEKVEEPQKETKKTLQQSVDLGKKQERSQKHSKEKSIAAAEYLKPEMYVDMETSVLGDQKMLFAYLTGCQENLHERIYINKSSFIIGRMKNQVDYVSQNNAVGKVHAEIIFKEEVYYIRDMNSRNGTYVNGERIPSNVLHIIKNNDTIAFANSEYKFIWK